MQSFKQDAVELRRPGEGTNVVPCKVEEIGLEAGAALIESPIELGDGPDLR